MGFSEVYKDMYLNHMSSMVEGSLNHRGAFETPPSGTFVALEMPTFLKSWPLGSQCKSRPRV